MVRLIHRRTVVLPTLVGWTCLFLLIGACAAVWWFQGESFLSHTDRVGAEVLAVEGWIGSDGVEAAAKEYAKGKYQYIVVTSGLSGRSFDKRRWSYSEEAARELFRLGVPSDRVIQGVPEDTESHRTFASAKAVFKALVDRNIRATGLNVFTLGPHARRSRLVFSKVFGRDTPVGVVAWIPPSYVSERWWRSSERALDFFKETLAYLFEALLNSGRWLESGHDSSTGIPAPNS
jgi:hypothetical protein